MFSLLLLQLHTDGFSISYMFSWCCYNDVETQAYQAWRRPQPENQSACQVKKKWRIKSDQKHN